MPTLTNSFKGLTVGTTISTSNSGGASGDAFDAVGTGTSTPSIASGGAHETVSASLDNANTAASSFVEWDSTGAFGSQTNIYYRFYMKISALPGHSSLRVFNVTTGSGSVMTVFLNASGKLAVTYSNTGISFVTFTGLVPVGSWFRVEGFVIVSTTVGQIGISLYSSGMDNTSADETHTSAATLNIASLSGTTKHSFGDSSSIALSTPILLSDIGISSSGPLGPAKNVETGSTSMKKMKVTSSSIEFNFVIFAVKLPKMGISGSLSAKSAGTAHLSMRKMRISASVVEVSVVTAAVSMPKMGISASGKEISVGTGGVILPKMFLSTVSLEHSVSTAHLSMRKMSLSGTGIEPINFSGLIILNKFRIQAKSRPPQASALFMFAPI